MSWKGEERFRWKVTEPHHAPRMTVDFETNWLRKEIHLNLYMSPRDEDMDDERLGMQIDDCVVEHIAFLLRFPQLEDVPIEVVEEFKEYMDRVEMGMREDPALQAYAVTLMRDRELPLSSEIYLDLAKRHALYGGIPAPTPDEGIRFVTVFLAQAMKKKNWRLDSYMKEIVRRLADYYLYFRDPGTLRSFIRDSEVSPIKWDALMLICKDLVKGGEEHNLPVDLTQWYTGATHGRPGRPVVAKASGPRPTSYGLKVRNKEIRHTVKLLVLAGMPELMACNAIADAFTFTRKRINDINEQDNWTIEELLEDGGQRLAPYMKSLPGSDSKPSYSI